MTILRDAPNDGDYLQGIEHIDVVSKFRNVDRDRDIRESIFREEDEDYDLYFAFYYKYPATLTDLVHYSWDSPGAFYNFGIVGLMDRFPYLTHLECYNSCDPRFILFDILYILNHLVSLKYVSDFADIDEAARGLQELVQERRVEDHLTPLKSWVKHLRTLYIALPSFNGAYIDYIVS